MMRQVSIQTNEGTEVLLPDASIDNLRTGLHGQVLLPSDLNYETARKLWNGMIDRRPSLIVQCADEADVVDAVHFARHNDLRLSVRGGGHNVAGTAMLDGGMVIDLSPMRGVSLDPSAHIVRVQAGARLGDIDRATQPYGLAVPSGVVSETGIAGLTLHGGFGWLSRKYGMTIDNLLAVDIVTADGQLRRADAVTNPDLFWAVRGGGGNFGIVTAFEFRAHPVGPQVWMAAPVYPASQRAEVIAGFRDFMKDAPDELNALAVMWSAPDDESLPAGARGAPVVILTGLYCGPVERGAEAVRPLYELGEPVADFGGRRTFLEAQTFFDDDYPDGLLYYWKSIYLDRLDDEVIAILAEHHDSRPSAKNSLDVWIFGGAVQRVPAAATAFPQRQATYMLGIEGNWEDPAQSEANIEWAREVYHSLEPYSPGGLYLNFPGFAEEEHLVEDVYAQNFARLSKIKAKYDPSNLFRGNFNIQPEA